MALGAHEKPIMWLHHVLGLAGAVAMMASIPPRRHYIYSCLRNKTDISRDVIRTNVIYDLRTFRATIQRNLVSFQTWFLSKI